MTDQPKVISIAQYKLAHIEQETGLSIEEIKQIYQTIMICFEKIQQDKRILIEANLNLIYSIVKKFLNYGLELADLMQEDSIGLIYAIERFDYSRGYRFATYAGWYVRRAITLAIANKSRTVRIPENVLGSIRSLKSITHNTITQTGRTPSTHQLSEQSNINCNKIAELLVANQTPISLDNYKSTEHSEPLVNYIEDSNASCPLTHSVISELKQLINNALNILSEQEAQVLRLRFGLDNQPEHTLQEIAQSLSISIEGARKMLLRAIDKLHKHLTVTEQLRAFIKK